MSVLCLLLLVACGDTDSQEPLRLHAMVAFPPRDTIRFDLPATTRQCRAGSKRSLLLEALSPEGSGVLLLLRFRDSLMSDSFPVVAPGDTAAAFGAVVAIRFLVHDTPRGYTLDSGSIQVSREGNTISGRGGGVGVESAIRIPARLEYRDVPIGTDTVPCRYAP